MCASLSSLAVCVRTKVPTQKKTNETTNGTVTNVEASPRDDFGLRFRQEVIRITQTKLSDIFRRGRGGSLPASLRSHHSWVPSDP